MMIEQENDQMQPNTPKQSSPGFLLRTAREAKQISLSDAATELRLSVQRLSDIENDRFSEMGATTFAKGYLRSYARFLGVSEEEVLQAFEHAGFESDIPTNKPKLLNEKMADSNAKGSKRLAYIIALLLVILIAIAWYHRETVTQTLFNSDTSVIKKRAAKNKIPATVNQTSVAHPASVAETPVGPSQYEADAPIQHVTPSPAEANPMNSETQPATVAPQVMLPQTIQNNR